MKILVTGATGFIGHEVARQLAGTNHHVRVLVRRPTRAPLVQTFGHEVVHGDLRSPTSLDRAVEGMDAVIHLAGRATFESYDKLAPTLVDGTAGLARAASDAGVRHLVFGSSAFVYGGSDDVIDGATLPDPVLDYGRAKVDAERVLDDIADQSPLTVGALRLPHVYGPQSLLFGLARKGFLPFPGRGNNRFAQLHVGDAARAMIVATERRWQGAAPIAAGESPSWNDFFAVLGEFAPRIRVVRLPETVAIVGAAVAGPVLGRLGPTMVTPDTIRGWNLDVAIDADPIWAELGLEPRHPTVTTGIPAVLDDVVSFRWRHPVNDFS